MTCATALESMVTLDRGERPGTELQEHLNSCAACRAVYQRLVAIETVVQVTPTPHGGELRSAREAATADASEEALTARIMALVRAEAARGAGAVGAAESSAEPARIRLPGWTAGGLIIIASLVLLPFSRVFAWLRSSMGAGLDVAIGTMLGLALTIYIMLLVGSNLPAVRRILRLRIR